MILRVFAAVVLGAATHAFAAEPVALTGRALGTTWTVKFLQPAPPLNPATLTARISATLERLEQQFSTYRPNSELSRFNLARTTDWITVSPELARVATDSRALSVLTGGAFDATIFPLVDLWGFGPQRRSGPPPSAAEISAARARTDFRRLESRAAPPALRKISADLAADFSSMAKGFAADTVAAQLSSLGSTRHYVQIGGDIATTGPHPWRVAIEHPTTPQTLPGVPPVSAPKPTPTPSDGPATFLSPPTRAHARTVDLAGQALSTSGDAHNAFTHAGRRYGHILDPRTGEPVSSPLASVSVIAPTCAQSSARATALFVLGPDAGYALALREQWPALFLIREGPSFTPRPTPEFTRLTR
ncbi:MAG: FAD:protein FMN transferase ApbE [Opitutia bacterium]|nr:MAG: FAD:protein FMN transferase ApbE [Opitutae bacterium]